MPVDNPRYIGARFTQLRNSGELPDEIREMVQGYYSELVRFATYHELGFERKSTRKIKDSTTIARVEGKLEQITNAAQRMAGIIDFDYNDRRQ